MKLYIRILALAFRIGDSVMKCPRIVNQNCVLIGFKIQAQIHNSISEIILDNQPPCLPKQN